MKPVSNIASPLRLITPGAATELTRLSKRRVPTPWGSGNGRGQVSGNADRDGRDVVGSQWPSQHAGLRGPNVITAASRRTGRRFKRQASPSFADPPIDLVAAPRRRA